MGSLLKISEAAALALHTMTILSKKRDVHMSVRDLAEKLNASEHHLAKVMQRLAKEGLVLSVRGPKGGFMLSQQAEKVTLLDVFEAVDGSIGTPECLMGLGKCVAPPCILGDTLEQVNRLVVDRLQKTNLGEFLSK